MVVVKMACLCSCIWGRPDPGPVRLQDMQQVVLDTKRTGMAEVDKHIHVHIPERTSIVLKYVCSSMLQ